ncbi:MAG: DUF1622 domain-containing protein [Eubacteriales bacterium]|nr:DUF1622 domain-containing protein [Eubacteriales bacterium]
MEWLETAFNYVVQIAIMLMEFAGVVVLVITGIKSLIRYFKGSDTVRLKLAQGIALSLEFKMGGEVLRTVIVREWRELAILGAIIVLRGLLTFLIHWEIKNEESKTQRDEV